MNNSALNYEELERRMYANGETDTPAYQAVLGCLEAEDDIDELTKENDELEEEISKIQRELDDVKDFCLTMLNTIDDVDETDLESCVKALDAVASIIEREIL